MCYPRDRNSDVIVYVGRWLKKNTHVAGVGPEIDVYAGTYCIFFLRGGGGGARHSKCAVAELRKASCVRTQKWTHPHLSISRVCDAYIEEGNIGNHIPITDDIIILSIK